MTVQPEGLEPPSQADLKKNHSSLTMTDSSTLAPSTFDNLNEKSLSNSRAASPTDGEKMDDIEVEDKAKEGEGGEKGDDGEYMEDGQKYPGPVALGLITLALCLAVFLVALVRLGILVSCLSLCVLTSVSYVGPNDHCNGHSQDHGPVWCS